MTLLAVLVKACGIALLMGALMGAFAWSTIDEPLKSRVLQQAKWLMLPGYVGLFLWAGIFGYGMLAWGCDPVFGGWTRTPLMQGLVTSEILSCREVQLQARGTPEARAEFPDLPDQWSQVYLHYDRVSGLPPDTSKVWLGTLDGRAYQVQKSRLQFRAVPPRRGMPWWQPQEAGDSW
jgi:hypothetical protein